MSDDIVVQLDEAQTYGYIPALVRHTIHDAKREILSLRAELTEQARLVGMGAERELKLIAERDEARGEVAAIVAWLREEADMRFRLHDEQPVDGYNHTRGIAVATAADAIEARSALPLRPFELANYIKSPEDLVAYREAAIEGEVAAIVAYLSARWPAENYGEDFPAVIAWRAIEARAYVKENDGD